ncbi:MAG: hypothetical protein KZY55_13615 [Paeniclostridium sp.]|nr:hypothetical protein [Paeniclostridium sp.]MBW4861657.1 hypothetical protein [Paeniclostridium sp.]MBW4875093.1 hypothetical protein [Paeniclostridium sp.]
MTKKKKLSLLLIIEILIGLSSSVFLISKHIPSEYSYIFLLPLFFSMCILVTFKNYVIKLNKLGTGMYILNVVMLIRYIISPVSMASLNSYYGGFGPNLGKKYIDFAIIMMIFEMLSVFIVIVLKYNNRNTNKEMDFEFLDEKFILIIVCILGIIYLFPYFDEIIPKNLFILPEDYNKNIQIGGSILVIKQTVAVSLFLISLKFLYLIYLRNRIIIIPYISAALILIFMGINMGSSRWNVIIPCLVGLYAIKILYPNQFKKIIFIVLGVLTISILSISMYKFSWAIKKPTDIIEVFAMQLQDYFSGPKQVAQGIAMSYEYSDRITIKTFFNDFLGSIPIVSNFINQDNRINNYFNLFNMIGNKSLIIPMVSNGFVYFGAIFAPMLSVICTIISMDLSYKIKSTKFLEVRLVYLMIVFWTSMFMGFNAQIVFGNIVIVVISNLVIILMNSNVYRLKKFKNM